MTDLPRLARDGAGDLLSHCSEEDISQVVIAAGKSYEKVLKTILSNKITPDRTYFYTPPGTVGNKRIPREEKIPQIKDPTKTYVIIDDLFERGGTLRCAVQALEEQGVKRENIWFFVMGVSDYTPPLPLTSEDHPFCYLDRAEVFLRYREKFPSPRPEWANDPELAARLSGKRG